MPGSFLTDDISVFLGTDDFGQEVVFTLSGGGTVTCNAIFDDEFTAAETYGLILETSSPVLLCKASEITEVAENDTVVVDGTTYDVMQIQPDGTGMAIVVLGNKYN